MTSLAQAPFFFSRAKTLKGNVAEYIRLWIGDRDGWQCHYCGIPLDRSKAYTQTTLYFDEQANCCRYKTFYLPSDAPTIDHKVPRSHGGDHSAENLVMACHSCNTEKHLQDYESFLAKKRAQR